jgi:hypothetical protein
MAGSDAAPASAIGPAAAIARLCEGEERARAKLGKPTATVLSFSSLSLLLAPALDAAEVR